MKSGYDVFWTDHAREELNDVITYIQKRWTEKEVSAFVQKLDHTVELISKSPRLFPQSTTAKGTHRAVVESHNTLYYRISNHSIQILSLFSNRKDPKTKDLKANR